MVPPLFQTLKKSSFSAGYTAHCLAWHERLWDFSGLYLSFLPLFSSLLEMLVLTMMNPFEFPEKDHLIFSKPGMISLRRLLLVLIRHYPSKYYTSIYPSQNTSDLHFYSLISLNLIIINNLLYVLAYFYY